jgi:TonB-linked SusC/RagA family outer membrane protein
MRNILFFKFFFVLLFLFNSFNVELYAFAPNKRTAGTNIIVSGIVTDNKGEPLPGATILIKGSKKAVITDSEGKFQIDAPEGSVLVFRYIGFDTKEVEVKDQSKLNIVLNSNTKSLDEVIVVGYGSQKKSDITGAVSSVSKDRIANAVVTDVIQLLQGAVAGLNVSTTAAGSNPESGAVLLIRGRNSISASNDPLIVLDGVPYYGSISDINPSDVGSIEVLKDASSTAIYGSRASNGVILIQTKKGEKGKTTVTYNGFSSIQSVANFPTLMNGEEYYSFKLGEDPLDTDAQITPSELEVYNSGSWKDWTWKDLVLRSGFSQQHNLSFSGGSQTASYRASYSFLKTEGVVINDNYKRGSIRINATSKINNWLSIGTNTNLTYSDNSGAQPSFIDLFNKTPLAVPFNPDGSVNITPVASDDRKINPIENLLYDDLNKKHIVASNNYIDLQLPSVKGLTYRLNTGLQYQTSEKNFYRGNNTGKSFKVGGEAETNVGEKYSYTIENIFSYKRDFGKHTIFLTGLYSIEEKENKNSKITANGFANDFLSYYGIPQAINISPSYEYDKTDMISQMFRANYSFDSRYLFTATVRRDGFSGFGVNTKFGTFPSIAGAWNISNENFFSNLKSVVNLLKIRGSYGESGNQAINPYQTISQLSASDYIDGSSTAPGYVPSTLGTPGLGWETTKALNFGIDFGILNSKITGEINVYRNNTEDLLLKRSISAVHGINNVYQNIGKTRNEGLEFLVNANIISKKDFKWSSNLNFALIKTEIKDLYGDGKDDIANKWFIGQNILSNYDLKFIGVWQLGEESLAAQYGAVPGYARYDDYNGDGVYSPADRQLLGAMEPLFTWGFNNTLKYKDFGLAIFVYGKNGATKVNPYKDRSYLINREFWTPENPTNDFWSNNSQATRYLGKGNEVSVYENADFVRIKEITLSYELPKDILNSARVKLYLTGKNLFTFTQWGALDPELDNQRAVPLQREFIFGLDLSF